MPLLESLRRVGRGSTQRPQEREELVSQHNRDSRARDRRMHDFKITRAPGTP